MILLEILYRIVGIVSGLFAISEKYRNYIKSEKGAKRDPSASLTAPDGSDDDYSLIPLVFKFIPKSIHPNPKRIYCSAGASFSSINTTI